MTDPVLAADPATAPLAEPGQRGRTDIAGAAVEHIACRAAVDVPGVTSEGSGLRKVLGRQYPTAQANVAGRRARVAMEVAVVWPYPLATVAAQVRDTVAARLHELCGLDIDAVDVSVASVTPQQPEPVRRVQ